MVFVCAIAETLLPSGLETSGKRAIANIGIPPWYPVMPAVVGTCDMKDFEASGGWC